VLKDFISGLSTLIYPPNCLICHNHIPTHQPHDILCQECKCTIPINRQPFCLKCTRPLPSILAHPHCPKCQEFQTHFDFVWAACPYTPVLKNLIHQFKYHQKTLLKYEFADLMTSFINRYKLDITQFDMCIPIPLSKTKYRERGYNQAELLARLISQRFSLNLNKATLVRNKHTKSQTACKAKERWTNTQGTFKISNSNIIKNKNIILIDDLLTTGATASECALTLKRAGCQRVGIFTLAITT